MRCLLLPATILCATCLQAQGEPLHFNKGKELALGAPQSFDYLSVDTASRRLMVAHGTRIDLFDLDKGEKAGSVDGLEGAHGAVLVPELKRGFATSGRKDKCVVFDAASYKIEKEIPTGGGPDALLYVTATKEVWTMNHRGGSITCIDASSLETKATIEIGGTLEFAVEWPAKGRVFVNVEDKNFIAEIDAVKHTLLKKHALSPAEAPTGLAIDQNNGILFCGCDKLLAVVDAATGKVIATPAIGSHCDAVAFDVDHHLAFASCGDGTTTVVREVDAHTFEVAGKIDTAPGGKTCTLDPKTHALWIAAGTRGKDDARLIEFTPDAGKPAPKK